MMENKNIEKRLVTSMAIGIAMYACLGIGMLQIHTNTIQTLKNALQVQQKEHEGSINLLNKRIDVQDQTISNLQQQNEQLKQKINEWIALPKYIDYSIVQYDNSIKCWMDYRMVTDKTSPQWEILQDVYLDSNGFCKIGDYYCVAMGSHFGTAGDKFKLTLESGKSINVILGDEKDDKDVVDGVYHPENNSIIEFLVQTNQLNEKVKRTGDCSYIPELSGKIIRIQKEI